MPHARGHGGQLEVVAEAFHAAGRRGLIEEHDGIGRLEIGRHLFIRDEAIHHHRSVADAESVHHRQRIVVALVVGLLQEELLQCAEDGVLQLRAELALVHRVPEALAHDHQAHIVALLGEFHERLDAIVQPLVLADEAEEEEHMLPQSVLRFPGLFAEGWIGLEEGVDGVVELEDGALGREISRPLSPRAIQRQGEFLRSEKRLQFLRRLVRMHDEAVPVPKGHAREPCVEAALLLGGHEVQVEEDLGLRVLAQVLGDGLQRNALRGVVPLDDDLVGLQGCDGLRGLPPGAGGVPVGEVMHRDFVALKEIAAAGLVHELARDDRRVLLRPAHDGDLRPFILQRTRQRRVVLRDAAFELGAGAEADDVHERWPQRRSDAENSTVRKQCHCGRSSLSIGVILPFADRRPKIRLSAD